MVKVKMDYIVSVKCIRSITNRLLVHLENYFLHDLLSWLETYKNMVTQVYSCMYIYIYLCVLHLHTNGNMDSQDQLLNRIEGFKLSEHGYATDYWKYCEQTI